jgi:hypothetical protein
MTAMLSAGLFPFRSQECAATDGAPICTRDCTQNAATIYNRWHRWSQQGLWQKLFYEQSQIVGTHKIRSRVEHVFADQKDRMDLFIRTIGIARAKTKIGLANFVYNLKRLMLLRRIAAA